MSAQDCEQLSLFPVDSPVSHSVWPGSAEARTMTVTSGQRCLELSKNSGPLGLLEKTLLESSVWRSTRCFLTWKTRVTKQGRLLFRLAVSMPSTGGTDAPLWLGTMTASQTGGSHSLRSTEHRKGRTPSPAEFVMMGPTATAAMYATPQARDHRTGQGKRWLDPARSRNLNDQIAAMFPTPTTGEGLCGGTGNYQQLKALEESGEITAEERKSMASGSGGQLNPTWVEWLMGFHLGWTDLSASETP